MPTYQYQCKNCGHVLEEFQSITEPPLTHCPNCNTDSLMRAIGTGAGLIFKGSGFYLTDYKKSNSSPSEKSHAPRKEKAKDSGGSKPEGGSESSGTKKKEK